MVLDCHLFRFFRACFCSFCSSALPLAHSLLFCSPRSPLLSPARFPFRSPLLASLLFPLASAFPTLAFRRLLSTQLCLLALSQEQRALETAVQGTMQRLAFGLRACQSLLHGRVVAISRSSRIGPAQFGTKPPGMVLPAATACCCCYSCCCCCCQLEVTLLPF